MPTYEYKCEECNHFFEIEQRITDQPLKDCPECKTGKVRRLISGGAGIAFKGKGFYVNDSAAKSGKKSCKTCQDNKVCSKNKQS